MKTLWKHISLFIFCFLLIGQTGNTYAQSEELPPYIGIRIPYSHDPRVPMEEDEIFLGMHQGGLRSSFLKHRTSSFRRTVELDSTGSRLQFVETIGDVKFRLPTYISVDNYIEEKRQSELKRLWHRTSLNKLGDRSRYSSSGGGGLRIDIPVEIKNRTFQKIFGSGTVGLDVTGEINIRGGFRREDRSEVKTAMTRGNDTSFKMEQTQRFRVQGHIGEKVTIGVDQDSERAFDFDNNIRLKYEGYEDEIIQSIEAGNISLSLPGTRYVTFGGKSSGLFGIKAAATIGRLQLTAIASQEKGEKKKISLSGGSEEETFQIKDYEYRRGVYYFIDEYYRQQYLVRDEENGAFIIDPNRIVKEIEVYKSEARYEYNYAEAIRGWAWVPENDDAKVITEQDTSIVDSEHYRGYFLRLEKNEDYYVDTELGYLRMNNPLRDGEVLAIAYRDSSGRIRGQINFNPDTDKNIQLRLMKTQTARPTDATWPLEWKNVYYLGARNIPEEGFEVRIFYKPSSGDPQETLTLGGAKMTYLQAFGLDKVNESGDNVPDNKIDNNPNILNLARGELLFPSLRPFDPEKEGNFQDYLEEEGKLSPALYDTTVQSAISAESKFYIDVKSSKGGKAEHSLGMNVIENSEEVRLNGRMLQRGIDYTIDYFTGTLRILDESATGANANLDVTYESNQIFQIEKKTVMGVRGEYDLWEDSFIGATFLYLNETTLDQKIRVGKGPMRNMVWDVNTSLAFKPFFLTRFANFLPFVETRTPSSLKFEGEIAQVLPNPNTKNNENTGDNEGVAYIDDFEAAKRITPIGVIRRGWNYCSPPKDDRYFDPEKGTLETRGSLVYFNPYNQWPIREIWPNRDINANVAQRTNILVMDFTPADSIANITESWNGIQRDLSAGYRNQTEAKFLEVWIKGQQGRVHIDLGQVSEDIIPNGSLDTEDRIEGSIRNGVLDDGEDTGLDGMRGVDPNDFWDLNGNGVRDWGEPLSYDDWRYDPEDNREIDYSRVNGTENNANDNGGRYPDTEDMNGNGDVDLRNDYYEYSFTLGDNHPDAKYIAGKSIDLETGTDYGWRLYRIPIDAPEPTKQKIGTPDISLIEYVRIWLDGFEKSGTHRIYIAEVNLVGNEWKEGGTSTGLDPDHYDLEEDPKVTVSVVNTHDNPEYIPPPGVAGEVDRITQVQAKEQSLVLNVDGLGADETGIIQKTFYDPQDYIHYRTLKMYVYARDFYGRHITDTSSNIEFFLRFGADKNNYYEIRKRLLNGWSPNTIEIDLVEFSALKLDSSYYDRGELVFIQQLDDRTTLRIKGEPALRNVRTLIAGVKNCIHGKRYQIGPDGVIHLQERKNGKEDQNLIPFHGQVYMNELRLSNVKKEKGMAMRSRMDFAWADLIRFNGEVTKEDADFHNVAQRFGTGDNEFSYNYNTSIQLDKFLPSQLGISLPVSWNYANSEATPKYVPGTDVEITDTTPDSVIEQIQKASTRMGYNVSLGFSSRSQNFFVKNLLSGLKVRYSKNESESSDSRTLFSTSEREAGNIDWGITFGDNYIRPFKWLGESRWVRKLAGLKLYYTPSRISNSIDASKNVNKSETRTGVPSENSSHSISRNHSLQMNIFENLTLDIGRQYTHDLRDYNTSAIIDMELVDDLINGELGLLSKLDQNFSVKFNPKIVSWLTNNFSFSNSYNFSYNRQNKTDPRNVRRNRNLSLSGSFNLRTLINSATGEGPGGRRMRPGRRAPQRPPGSQNQKDEKGEEDDGSNIFYSAAGYFFKFFTIFEPFSFNGSWRENASEYGLRGMPSWQYQFGLQDSIGIDIQKQESDGGSTGATLNRSSYSNNLSWSVSSGFSISRNVKLTLKYDASSQKNKSTQLTGQRTQSWIRLGDMNGPGPDWNFKVSGLEKLPLVKKYFQRISLDHAYSSRLSETFDNQEDNITKTDTDASFRPLVGINLSMSNGISMQVRYNTSEKESLNKGFGVGGTRTSSSELSFSASYSKRSDFRIPIPVWPFNNMRLKNNIDIQIAFNMGSNKTEKYRGNEGKWGISAETSKWTFKPSIRYSFSNRVRGGAHFEIGKTQNKILGDSSFKEFGIEVNIAIRGN